MDGVTFEGIEASEGGLEGWLGTLAAELREEGYRPQAVRRVRIPKPDGGERPLGIPTVRDRVVQQAAKLVLEPIFEADFEPNAYGYRRGRGALDAVKEVQASILRGESHVVDADLSRYFDTIPHAELMKSVARRISDKRTGQTYLGVAPSKRRVKRFKQALRTVLHAGNHAPLDEVVEAVNRKLRGWAEYFSIGTLEPTYRTLDHYTSERLRTFLVRRHKVPGRGTRRFSYPYLYEELKLMRLQDRRRVSRTQALA